MVGKKKKSVEDILHVLIIFCLECLESSDRVLLFSERHTLLRVLPVLVVLATSGEKEGESIFKKIKIPRLLSIFKVNISMHYLWPFFFSFFSFFLEFSWLSRVFFYIGCKCFSPSIFWYSQKWQSLIISWFSQIWLLIKHQRKYIKRCFVNKNFVLFFFF
jgi:hypothetical protein